MWEIRFQSKHECKKTSICKNIKYTIEVHKFLNICSPRYTKISVHFNYVCIAPESELFL
jgi:hypothetical protein